MTTKTRAESDARVAEIHRLAAIPEEARGPQHPAVLAEAHPWAQWYAHGRGVTAGQDLRRIASINPRTEYHDGGDVTIDYPRGGVTRYTPVTTEEAEAVMAANRARLAAAREAIPHVFKALRAAGLTVAQWMQRGGNSGIDAFVSGGAVRVHWWHSTDAEQSAAKKNPDSDPWAGGVRDQARTALEAFAAGRGLTVTDDRGDLVLAGF